MKDWLDDMYCCRLSLFWLAVMMMTLDNESWITPVLISLTHFVHMHQTFSRLSSKYLLISKAELLCQQSPKSLTMQTRPTWDTPDLGCHRSTSSWGSRNLPPKIECLLPCHIQGTMHQGPFDWSCACSLPFSSSIHGGCILKPVSLQAIQHFIIWSTDEMVLCSCHVLFLSVCGKHEGTTVFNTS